MTKRHTPPGRMSNALVVVVKPSGPHHCDRCLGSVHAVHTSSRGASNSRMPTIARGSLSRSTLFLAATLALLGLLRILAFGRLGLQLAEIVLQAVEPLLPKPAIILEPLIDRLQRLRLDLAGPPLRLAAARDQACTLQHLEMLGDGRAADVEWLGQLGHRG